MKIISFWHGVISILWQNTEDFPSLFYSHCNPGIWLHYFQQPSFAHTSPTTYLQYESPHLAGSRSSLQVCCGRDDKSAHCCSGVTFTAHSESSHFVCNVALSRKKRAIVEITPTLYTVEQGAAFYFVCLCYRSICV